MKRNLTGLVERSLRGARSGRSHPIEQIVLRSVGRTRQPAEREIADLAKQVAQALEPLLGVALSGNVTAIRQVTELATTLCAETLNLVCLHPSAADTVARERTTWPLNVSHDPRERRRALRLVTGRRRLPLGNPPLPRPVGSRASGLARPASTAVLVALKAVESERSFRIPAELFPTLQPAWSAAAERLPELEPATCDAWFKVLWMYICERHGGTPERSALRQLVAGPALAAESTAADASARAELRRKLQQAFHSLVQGRKSRRRRSR